MESKGIPYSRPTIRKEELKTTLECLISDAIGPGSLAREFEKQLARYLDSGRVRTISSGTLAFFLILKLLKVKSEDEILLPSYAPASLLNPIRYLGAVPVPVDVSLTDYAPLKEEVQKKITEKTRGLLLSHLFGLPVKVSAYEDLGIPLIEHASHALGAQMEGRKCGSLADFAFFSFDASQMISTGGTGGAVVCKNKTHAEGLSALLEGEKTSKNEVSYPFLMSDLQAAMGLSQLSQLSEFIESRKKIADYYSQALKNAEKTVPLQFIDRSRVFFQYSVGSSLPLEESLQFFKKYEIEARRPIESPLHRILGLPAKDFPHTEQIYHETLSLPIYPTLKKKEVELIAKLAVKI